MKNRLREPLQKLARRLAALLGRAGLMGEVHYINGPETLPAPLTAAEEAKIMQNIRDGVRFQALFP